MRQKLSITIQEKFVREIDALIDHIYIKNRSQAIEHLVQQALGDNKPAVILLGGDDSHLQLGKDVFRPLALVKKKPLIVHAIEKLKQSGFSEIFLVARHPALTKLFAVLKNGEDYNVTLHYVEELKNARGTKDTLQSVKDKISSNFLVVYGDLLFTHVNIEEIWSDHLRQSATATIMLTTSSTPREKGTVKVEGTKVLEFTQKPRKSDIYLVFSPIFAADPELFDCAGHSLEFDVFPSLASKGLLSGHLSSEKEKHIHELSDLK